jgi:hypothetical protein
VRIQGKFIGYFAVSCKYNLRLIDGKVVRDGCQKCRLADTFGTREGALAETGKVGYFALISTDLTFLLSGTR